MDTPIGEWWFIHFQNKGPYRRIVRLEPVTWKDGWPMMGVDQNNDGIGASVDTYRKPNVGKRYPVVAPQTSDDFDQPRLGMRWQWQAGPDQGWYSLHPEEGFIRLNAVSVPSENGQLWICRQSVVTESTRFLILGGNRGKTKSGFTW